MICGGNERRGRQIDYVVVRIEAERDVVRDPEDAVTSADHSLLVPTVGKSQAWRELMLIQWQVIPAGVGRGPDQQYVTETRGSRSTVAAGHGRIGHGRIPIAQAVLTL